MTVEELLEEAIRGLCYMGNNATEFTREAKSNVHQALAQHKAECEWKWVKYGPDEYGLELGCGEAWNMTEVRHNLLRTWSKHCPNCGKKIKEVK